jgi:hypothetical protein
MNARGSHPLAVVAKRHYLAAIDGAEVWYVFRDGSMVAPMHRDSQ